MHARACFAYPPSVTHRGALPAAALRRGALHDELGHLEVPPGAVLDARLLARAEAAVGLLDALAEADVGELVDGALDGGALLFLHERGLEVLGLLALAALGVGR